MNSNPHYGIEMPVQVGGRVLRVTNLDKVLYPRTGTTKAEVIEYYTLIADTMLPHLNARPVTRKRWPEGIGAGAFFEKNTPGHAPDWVAKFRMHHDGSGRFGEPREARDIDYVLVDEVATLVWLAQLAALELHVPQWQIADDAPAPPDRLVIDLDPGAPAGVAECALVAQTARELLTGIGLQPRPVLSGSKGIHVYGLGLVAHSDGQDGGPTASDIAKAVAAEVEAAHPDLVTTTMTKAARPGKVFLDWSQNNMAKTTICPYSLRGRDTPTVACPVAWDELQRSGLRQFELGEVLDRVSEYGDLFDAD